MSITSTLRKYRILTALVVCCICWTPVLFIHSNVIYLVMFWTGMIYKQILNWLFKKEE